MSSLMPECMEKNKVTLDAVFSTSSNMMNSIKIPLNKKTQKRNRCGKLGEKKTLSHWPYGSLLLSTWVHHKGI